MPVTRHFLGWDEPVVEKVSAWLLENRSGPVDLHDTLVVVPTLQAGRRLREVLARHGHDRHTALLSVTLVTPHVFFACPPPGLTVAPPALTRAVWTHVLQTVDVARFSVFFPHPQRLTMGDRFAWALATGEIIERLRQELTDGGFSIPDVIKQHGNRLEELERWNDLAGLEQLYLQKLSAQGFSDACAVKIQMADHPSLEPFVRRIVVAAVPDPSLLAARALAALARDHAVEILIHAPAGFDHGFDEWGRPRPDVWTQEEVDIPDWENNVFLEASPDAQSRKVVDILSSLPADYGPADIGIGVPDTAVIPFLKKELHVLQLPGFDPSDAPFEGHFLGRLVGTVYQLLLTRAYLHAADLLRHPDFLGYLEQSHAIESGRLLQELDAFQNYYLPVTLDSMLTPFSGNPRGTQNRHDDFSLLGKALAILKAHLDDFENKPLEEAWRTFLQSVYETRPINQDAAGDREFQQAADVIEQTFREVRELPAKELGLTGFQLAAVFVRRLQEQTYHRERTDERVDLQGWLELPWTDTPVLIVTGLNEDFVPGGSLSDVFLPDSLRKMLNLRDDLSRFGRDVYLLKTMVESRRRNGRLCILVGKQAMTGDPLRPSRLLFRCSDSRLPQRAQQLFKPMAQAGRAPASDIIFRLKPAAAEKDKKILEDKVISVTALADYLACPFRFYLKHILKMEPLSDEKNELDALDFGQLVHGVLETMGRDQALWACSDADRLGKHLAGLVDRMAAERYGKVLPLAALVALASARTRLEALARVQVGLVQEGWEIIACEQKKTLSWRGFTLVGKIDRLDRNKTSGVIRILDYKTTDTARLPWETHVGTRRETTPAYNRLQMKAVDGKSGKGKEKKWIDLQLPLYHLLCSRAHAFEAGLELAYFNLPKAISETAVVPWTGFNAEGMASALACLEGVLAGIDGGVFWPPAERVEYDRDFEMLFLNPPQDAFDISGFSS